MACKVNITLPSGFSMPALGFGTWQAKDEEVEAAVDAALSAGYRHIDTAWIYGNEEVIGKVLKRWLESGKVKREELFIVTKLPLIALRPKEVEPYLNESLERLKLSYVDLYLIHLPVGYFKKGEDWNDWEMDLATDHLALWKEMEKQVDNGKVKAIGVSNFNNRQVERLVKNSRIPPATNQVELHLYLQQPDLVQFHKSVNVTVTAYSPLGSLGTKKLIEARGIQHEVPSLLENSVVVKIAQKHSQTPAQVLLRHIVQKGIAAIPKSTNPERIKQNLDIFNFELDPEDVSKLDGLDANYRILAFDKFFKGIEKHPEYPF